jgi:hypothetical protein
VAVDPPKTYCWWHDPQNSAERSRAAARGGRRAGRGRPSAELHGVREENADIRRRLLEGDLLPGVAAVAIQSLNVDIRALDTLIKAREQEELAARLEAVESALAERKRGYGA